MNIGELFISLGVKGTDKTVAAVASVRTGLKDTASAGFAAKAALVGVMYGMERLFSASNHQGTELSNFNTVLGVSSQTLQRYQYAAQQVGVSNGEVTGSFKSLQDSMGKILLGDAPPKGLERVAQLTGEISAMDIEDFAKKPELLLQRLQKYSQIETDAWLRHEVLSSFGLGDALQAALIKGAFKKDMMDRAPTFSDAEVKNLAEANTAWANLSTTIEMAIGHFNAKHGLSLTKDITSIVGDVVHLSESLVTLSEKVGLFEKIGLAIKGWTEIIHGATEAVNELSAELTRQTKADGKAVKAHPDDEAAIKGVSYMATAFAAMGTLMESFFGGSEGVSKEDAARYQALLKGYDKVVKDQKAGIETPEQRAVNGTIQAYTGLPSPAAVAAPRMAPTAPAPGKPGATAVTVHQTFQHPGTDPAKLRDSSKQGIIDAHNQINSRAGGY